jgi:hypothetical protein
MGILYCNICLVNMLTDSFRSSAFAPHVGSFGPDRLLSGLRLLRGTEENCRPILIDFPSQLSFLALSLDVVAI